MIYGDGELQAWWESLAEAERQSLLQKMIENAPSETFSTFADSLRSQWDVKGRLSDKQLAIIRKWE